MKKTKFIFITGGVYSSLGKGITASSIGRILKEMGFIVAMQKLDPYLNVDPENISPYQHGEVFVTNDGAKADLDLGNYERFTDHNLNKYSTITSGRIYQEVLQNERDGKYNGKTVQVVPHVTNQIISKLHLLAKTNKADFAIVEIGGTVGDLESLSFIEAINQFGLEYGKNNVMYIHCVPLISLQSVFGELKTKPAQHSVKTLKSFGITPDMLVLRSPIEVDLDTIEKISWLCNIDKNKIFVNNDLDSIYFLPNVLYSQNIHLQIFNYFKIKKFNDNFNDWIQFTDNIKNISNSSKKARILLLGEYAELHDAYYSVITSLKLASYELNIDLKIDILSIRNFDILKLKKYNGCILCPSNSEETQNINIQIIDWIIKNNFNTLIYSTAIEDLILSIIKNNNLKINKNDLFVKQKKMVLGKVDIINPNSTLLNIYKNCCLYERHHHWNEINNKYLEILQKYINILGVDKNNNIHYLSVKNAENVIATYSNPEFSSKPKKANPLFIHLLKGV